MFFLFILFHKHQANIHKSHLEELLVDLRSARFMKYPGEVPLTAENALLLGLWLLFGYFMKVSTLRQSTNQFWVLRPFHLCPKSMLLFHLLYSKQVVSIVKKCNICTCYYQKDRSQAFCYYNQLAYGRFPRKWITGSIGD